MDACPYRRVYRESKLCAQVDFSAEIFRDRQLLSVISLLSSDKPNLDSPANVDAAKEVRTDLEGSPLSVAYARSFSLSLIVYPLFSIQEESQTSRSPKCRRSVRLNSFQYLVLFSASFFLPFLFD